MRILLQTLLMEAFLAYASVASAGSLNDDQAQGVVSKIVTSDGLYAIKPHCLMVVGEASEKKFVQFVVREKVGEGCPGKVSAAGAVLDRFRVSRSTGAVKWQSAEGGKFRPYAKAGKAA